MPKNNIDMSTAMRRELIVHTRSQWLSHFYWENLIETFDFVDYIGGKSIGCHQWDSCTLISW